MPYLEFPNVARQNGEPSHIRWGLTLDSARLPVETAPGRRELVEFPRDWLCAKLQAAWEMRTHDAVKINQWLPTFNIEEATACRDDKALQEAVIAMLDDNLYRRLLARVTDGQTVETAYLPFKGKDTATVDYAEKLFAQVPGFDANHNPVFHPDTGEQVMVDRYSLARGIDNQLLLAEVEAGRLRLELLPRENVLLATKNAPGMANDIKRLLAVASNQELHQLAMAFGTDPRTVSRVALVVQSHEDKHFVVGGPYRLDSGPAYQLTSIPTPLNAGMTVSTVVNALPAQPSAHTAAATTTTPVPAQPTPAGNTPSTQTESARATPVAVKPTESSPPPDFPAAEAVEEEVDLDAAIDSAYAEVSDAEVEGNEPNTVVPPSEAPPTESPARGTPGHYDPERDPLLTDEQRRRMLAYGTMTAKGETIDPKPVVKLFTPDAQCTWLLTELDPQEPDIAFGLCDLGQGYPELGSVSLSEISQVRGPMKLKIERDLHFEAQGPLSAYAKAAREAQHIVEDIAPPTPFPSSASSPDAPPPAARRRAPAPQL